MTNPSDPGLPPRPPAGGQPPGGPYGPPPPPHPQQQPPQHHGTGPIPVPNPRPPAAPPGQGHGQGPQHPNQTGPGPYATGPQPQPWVPPEQAEKGLLGALLDTNFNSLVTPKLIKAFYILSLLLVSLSALIIVAIGIWVFQLRNGWLVGLLIMLSAPVVWFFEAMLVRIFMEAIMTRFKSVEYLRVIKDKR
ncbi:DUF4282 domain-containing protein [Actinomadura algeriensis]|uniref:DUF4282 domain-containing protein n=1 Tax=Actinomadura algeriensis TaxID=1679523 RepID=A0ABR9JUD0_9ACTN|nr:DUF4282 domain-containing protein [Actinomadura algeriensis]MBE1534176.1 hypothetical protein [Actinomadura algeriensis]